MEFNKVVRGAKREMNNEESVYAILDAGFMCHVAFQHQGQAMIIPTAYGREGDNLYIHGSTKNFMLNQILDGQSICISVTHLDGIVLAKSLFHTSVNYRSTVLFGKAVLVEDEEERMDGLKSITENIVKGRWNEVEVGDENQLKATMIIKFTIDSASAKIRNEGPVGDDSILNEVWSGHIPLALKAAQPIQDKKFGVVLEMSKSVKNYYEKHK
ncbi:MAG TPA: pyridoxamine 5'-phosphate oxidase family protein [Bacteroidia bacterium]|nr:pyridoxamine 5'-phosphate oxidase family protein [Bacteroidia bacterium]HRH09499.1 pyridoxamine 5'-phosphate oxidase family protein [Bacteroidia bacterium]HRH62942.1 pyridoxamine 5'-phosphate oxidase family protein [Bacteroidia bacterium]